MKEITVYEYFLHVSRIRELRKKMIKYWKENKLDFIICAGFACPANRHGTSTKITLAAAYTYIWNLL